MLFAKLCFFRNRNSQFRNYRNFRNPFYNPEQEAYCHEIKCPPLANPDNGVITLGRGSETVNSTAELKCDEGYSVWTNPENPNGEHARTIKCGVNGEWENEVRVSAWEFFG